MTKYLSNIDLNQNQLLNSVLQNLAMAPSTPKEGQMYYNTATQRAYICIDEVGPTWQEMDGLSAMMSAADIVNTINASALLIDDNNLSAAVNSAIAKAHDSHTISTITGLQTALDGKANTSHNHTIANITNLQTTLDGKASTTHNHTLDSLSNTTITSIVSGEILKWNGSAWINNTLAEAGIAPVSHTHTIGNITSLQDALDDKSDVGHGHTIANITNLQSTLDGKASSVHTHTIADTTGLQTALDGKSATTHNHTLNSLSNVTITSIATGEILRWNGTAWVNNTLAEAGVASTSHTHSISSVSGLQTALDGKVDDSQVLTNVPAGAVFTDTVTTINGNTGIITKADITALGIPGQDTTYSVFTSTTNGLAPLSGGGTTKYLRADGTWTVPPNTIYTLPVASATLGGVKSGTDITVDASGNVSVKDDSHNHIISNVDGLQAALDAKETPAGALAKATVAENNAKAYTDTQIDNIIGAAPGTLDTLNELAAALGDDPNFATTITNQIAAKTSKYVATIGDGTSTSFALGHNKNTRDVVVTIRETGAPYNQVITDVEMTSVNTTTIKFASPPALQEYTVTIIG